MSMTAHGETIVVDARPVLHSSESEGGCWMPDAGCRMPVESSRFSEVPCQVGTERPNTRFAFLA